MAGERAALDPGDAGLGDVEAFGKGALADAVGGADVGEALGADTGAGLFLVLGDAASVEAEGAEEDGFTRMVLRKR